MIPLLIKEETGSTSDDLWELFHQGHREPISLLACQQRQGRGRCGKKWHSQVPGNLYLSHLSFVDKGLESILVFVPLRAALEVISTLRTYSVSAMGVKWPNDIMSGNLKVGGILVESRSGLESDRIPLVIGIGLNLNSIIGDYPSGMRPYLTTLYQETGRHFPLIDMARNIVYNLDRWMSSLADQ